MKTASLIAACLSILTAFIGAICWWLASQRWVGVPMEYKPRTPEQIPLYAPVDAAENPARHIEVIRESFRDGAIANARAAAGTLASVLLTGLSTILSLLSN